MLDDSQRLLDLLNRIKIIESIHIFICSKNSKMIFTFLIRLALKKLCSVRHWSRWHRRHGRKSGVESRVEGLQGGRLQSHRFVASCEAMRANAQTYAHRYTLTHSRHTSSYSFFVFRCSQWSASTSSWRVAAKARTLSAAAR